MASALAGIFGALTRARSHAYSAGWRQARRLGAPVVSLGNLSVGGSGKTPATIALAQALTARGLRIDVLTRGYGRRSRGLMVLQGGEGTPAECGDEPLLIAGEAHVPVLVCADRFRAGTEGERRFVTQVHLLDDGFQHRRLARSFDIVLVQPSDLGDRLLPAGRMREPLSALQRAAALVWMSEAAPPAALVDAGLPIFSAVKRAAGPPPAEPALAFCALARPESFWNTLEELGASLTSRLSFRDHHRYTDREVAALEAAARRDGATCLVTTAKDEINLRGLAFTLPLRVVRIEFHCERMEELVRLALEACGL